jgi:hypothetical protein
VTFQLYSGSLPPGNPSRQIIADLQAQVDALSPAQQTDCEALLTSWGWKDTINPSPMIRLIWRALQAVGPP